MVKETKDKFDPPWSECSTFEQWFEKMIREGYIEIVKSMMNALPEDKKVKYRDLYKRIMSEKRGRKEGK